MWENENAQSTLVFLCNSKIQLLSGWITAQDNPVILSLIETLRRLATGRFHPRCCVVLTLVVYGAIYITLVLHNVGLKLSARALCALALSWHLRMSMLIQLGFKELRYSR